MTQYVPQTRKKALYIITKSNYGGAQRYVFDLATSIPQDAFEPVVAFGGTGESGSTPGELASRLSKANIRTLFIPELGRDVGVSDWKVFRAIIKILREERPDVVHLNSSKVGGLGSLAARLVGIKNIIFTSHGLAWDEDRNPLSRLFIYLASCATFIFCHKVITISKDTYDRARTCPFCADKIYLIHNGIREKEITLSKEAARRQLIPDEQSDDLWIGSVGELTANKNYLVALEAISKIPATISLLYLIAGDGEDRTRLIQRAKELGIEARVRFLGYVQNAAQYLAAFDILFMPSKKEGLPYTLLEAAHAGTPVVASSVGGIPDIIENNVSGLLCDATDVDGFATALETLAQDESRRAKLGNNLKSHAQQAFRFENMIRETIALY